MAETTEEFAARLEIAMEGNPRAPASVYGRQSWLREILKREAGREVSPNTVHKWVRGTARPRPDAMRDLARVLRVDEVWLSMGRKPSATPKAQENAASANGAALLLAGIIETRGGRVTFPSDRDSVVSFRANIGQGTLGIIALSPQPGEDGLAFIVPEPVGDNKIVGVVRRTLDDGCAFTVCFDLLDLTDLPRQNLGGFSLVQLAKRKDRAFKVEGQRGLVRPVQRVEDLAETPL